MASTIVTKNSSTASAVPVSGDLTQGELAVNVTDKRLFTKNSGGTVVELGTNPASLALPNGTANGVLYLNGSKVATSGSALYFDGTNLGVGTTSPTSYVGKVVVNGHQSILGGNGLFLWDSTNANAPSIYAPGDSFAFKNNAGSELMRLTSTGLGIGTSSPGSKLTVLSTGSTIEAKQSSAGAATYYVMDTTVETNGKRWRFGYTGASGTTPGMFSFLNVTDNVIGPVIDSSGNLGLGVTPSAWNASHPAFQFKYNTAISSYSSNDGLELTSNGYADTATTWKYIESYSAAQYVVGGGQHAWKIAALGTAGTAISFTQAMTLDASGSLGVGTTSPAAATGFTSSRVVAQISSSGGYGQLRLGGDTGTMLDHDNSGTTTTTLRNLYGATNASALIQIQSGTITFGTGTSYTERARIDSSGNLLVATSTVGGSGGLTAYPAYGGAGAYVGLIWNKSATNGTACEFRHNGTAVGSISSTATVTTYAISSDYRLKHDIAPMTGALAKVAALKPVTYKWNADDSDGEGFIAHELAEVVPHAVVGEKDAVDEEGNPVYQGIDTSFLVATLTAAIQEQQALITQLTERITALEGK